MTVGELCDELNGIESDLEVVAIDYGGSVNVRYELLDNVAVIDGEVLIEMGKVAS